MITLYCLQIVSLLFYDILYDHYRCFDHWLAGNIFTGFFQNFASETRWILSTVFFKLPENNTTIRREVYTGLISFLAVSYILAVNPAILGSTGMDRGGVFLATALAGFIGTLSMALYANKPLVLGTSTTTTFAESAVGIGAGARTGLRR